MQDAVLAEQVALAGEFEVVAAKRRALETGHVGGRRETVLPVVAGAVEQHADERLDAREVDRPVLALIPLVERRLWRRIDAGDRDLCCRGPAPSEIAAARAERLAHRVKP